MTNFDDHEYPTWHPTDRSMPRVVPPAMPHVVRPDEDPFPRIGHWDARTGTWIVTRWERLKRWVRA